MKPNELLDLVETAVGQGLSFITLRIHRASTGARMRIMPGLMGRVVGRGVDDTRPKARREYTIVSVMVDDVRASLARNLSSVEYIAVTLAEDGDDTEASTWFEEYRKLRDRLSLLGVASGHV